MSTQLTIGDRFQVDDLECDLLGEGSMGNVYRGTDLETGQAVAIKALKPEMVAHDPDIVARFVREGEALRQLNHPNIVKMVDAIDQESAGAGGARYYLVMEYVGGGTLQDLLEAEGRLSPEHAIEIALDVADALTRAHRLGIIHRDLKPANVMLAEDGTPRLTDFGVAHVENLPRLTQTGMVVGTIQYLSPEACQGETLDARTDIWGLGVMLYEMLTGELPFAGETIPATFIAILTQPAPDLSLICDDVPDSLADLISRMLEKERYQRIPSVRLVGAELEAILATVSGKTSEIDEQPSPAESRFSTPTPPTKAVTHVELAPSPEPPIEEKRPTSQAPPCPYCGASSYQLRDERWLACKSCGHEFDLRHELCPSCGHLNRAKATVCTHCRTPLREDSIDQLIRVRAKSRKEWYEERAAIARQQKKQEQEASQKRMEAFLAQDRARREAVARALAQRREHERRLARVAGIVGAVLVLLIVVAVIASLILQR